MFLFRKPNVFCPQNPPFHTLQSFRQITQRNVKKNIEVYSPKCFRSNPNLSTFSKSRKRCEIVLTMGRPNVFHLNKPFIQSHRNPTLLASSNRSLTCKVCSSNNILYYNIVTDIHSRRNYSTISDVEKNKISIPVINPEIAKSTTNSNEPVAITDEIISRESHYLNQKFASTPKNVLHNVYDTLVKELSDNNLKLKPVYHAEQDRKGSTSWRCVYNIKWPEPMKFIGHGRTKKEASHKSALAALLWLRKHDKISKEGDPLVIDKSQQKEIIKKTTLTLKLDQQTCKQMKDLIHVFKQEFSPNVAKTLEDDALYDNLDEINISEDLNFKRPLKQATLSYNTYLAKEKVKLPIAAYKEQFMDLLENNSVVIIKGEPGCGKSTRIPQYVLESWIRYNDNENKPCRIAVTQPRRIAAISLAERVANERDESVGHIIGYQVRLKSNFNQRSGRVLYCTTGILLRHLQSDPNLSNFSHVILDEAHERDVNTDLLMNILKTTMHNNKDLKLIVMSATIETEKFKNYFGDAPVMQIPGFTYPVESKFLEDITNVPLLKTRTMCETDQPSVIHEDVVKVVHHIHKNRPEGAILCFLPGWEDISKIRKLLMQNNPQDVSILCLHSRVRDSDQHKIFSRPPPGVRKIILATNIAETSVTIDDVVYVIDTGIHKETVFDNDKGILCIDNHWISKSSMTQRKGRAGRVQPGESYHLYTKSKYKAFTEHVVPEILRTSLTKIVLDAKVYSNNQCALEFMDQLISPPDKGATKRAVRELKDLELLDEDEKLTSLGKTLANFQLEPKLAKTLVNAVVYKCVTPIVDIVTLFSADTDIFANTLTDKSAIKRTKALGCNSSDHLALMRLFEKWLEHMDRGEYAAEQFCNSIDVVHNKLRTMSKLREIHFDYLHKGLRDSLPISDSLSDNDELVKAVLYSGVGTLLQHRNWDIVKGRYKKTNLFLTNYNQKATITSDSVNFKKTSFPSNLLVYINEVRSNIRRTTLIRESSVISPLAVLLFSNKKLEKKEVETEDGNVLLQLADTKIKFLCPPEDADTILKCKEVLNAGYQYFIFQMTDGGQFDSTLNKAWDNVLSCLNNILLKCSIDS